MRATNREDRSDAGTAYFLMTGDEEVNGAQQDHRWYPSSDDEA